MSRIFLSLFLFLSLALNAAAQDSFRGRITGSNGSAVAGASVTLRNLTTSLERLAIHDVGGSFSFPATLQGSYRLTAKAIGFGAAVRAVESMT